jgi:hypothetical protein
VSIFGPFVGGCCGYDDWFKLSIRVNTGFSFSEKTTSAALKLLSRSNIHPTSVSQYLNPLLSVLNPINIAVLGAIDFAVHTLYG